MGSTKIWCIKKVEVEQNNSQELDSWSQYLYAMKSPVTRKKYTKRLEKFKFFRIKSPNTFFEISIKGLEGETIQQIENQIKDCKTFGKIIKL